MPHKLKVMLYQGNPGYCIKCKSLFSFYFFLPKGQRLLIFFWILTIIAFLGGFAMSSFLFFKTFSKIMFKDVWRDFDTTLNILCIFTISIYHQGYMCHQGSTGPTLCICFQKKVHFSKDKLILFVCMQH